MGSILWTAWVVLAMWQSPTSFQQVQATSAMQTTELGSCSCQQEVTVSLNGLCSFTLTLANVGLGNCPASYQILVNDPQPNNGATVDCVGRWPYTVVTAKGEKVCGGTIIAVDATGPQVISWQGRQDTFWCVNLSAVLDQSASYTNPAYPYYTGQPVFRDNCFQCGCSSIQLTVTDRVEWLSCPDLRKLGVYARVFRQFRGKDCRGNTTDTTQVIQFKRPAWQDFTAKDTLRVSACSLNDIQGGLSALIKQGVSIPNPYDPRHPQVSLLELSCGYTTAYSTTSFSTCDNGQIWLVDLSIKDQCGVGTGRDSLWIVLADQEAPQIKHPNQVFTLPTGPTDCTASLPLDPIALRQLFGLQITDNCTANPAVTYRVQSKGMVFGGLAIPGPTWQEPPYVRITQGGRTSINGLPIFEHRLLIQAKDGCGNERRDTLYFTVQDKTPPLVSCDDQLNVTLTASVGPGGEDRIAYASVSVADINEGSTDNCLLTELLAYRIVPASCLNNFSFNPDYDLDGDDDMLEHFTRIESGPYTGSYQSPALLYVEFFCCDAGQEVPVFLVARDQAGNTNTCESSIKVTDNTIPQVISLPPTITVYCQDFTVSADLHNPTKADERFGKPVLAGSECQDLPLEYTLDSLLECGSGYYRRHWKVRKTIEGREVLVDLGSQIITVLPVHEYAIYFPADVTGTCATVDGGGVVLSEMACDVLAVNTADSPYSANNDACRQVFRTHTVINWCEFSEWQSRCTDQIDPMQFAQVVPRFWDQNKDGDTRDIYDIPNGAGRWLLVRDREATNTQYTTGIAGKPNGVEEIYLSRTQDIHPAKRVFPYVSPASNLPGGLGSVFVFDDISIENFCQPLTNAYGTIEQVPTFAWQYTQLIRWQDTLPPIVTAPPGEISGTASSQTCTGLLQVMLRVEDNCLEALTVNQVRIALEQGPNWVSPAKFQPGWVSPVVLNGQLNIQVANLPLGKHNLEVTVSDYCGNPTTLRLPFLIRDTTGPALACKGSFTMNILPDPGNNEPFLELSAYELITAPAYDCSGQSATGMDPAGRRLVTQYSINRTGEPVDSAQKVILISCADAGSTLLVETHAWDVLGNQQVCTTAIQIGVLGQACDPPFPDSLLIGGQIFTEPGYPVSRVKVSLSQGMQAEVFTDDLGAFLFDSLPPGLDYTLKPERDGDDMLGVSTYDLVLIQKHILGVEPFQSPYQLLAADVNNSGEITVADLVQLRRLILGYFAELPDNRSWRFVDASFTFPDPVDPWKTVFPEVINFNNLSRTRMDADFVAIKIGDVSENAGAVLAGSNGLVAEKNWTLEILASPQELSGQQKIPIRLPDLRQVDGVQFALAWNPKQLPINQVLPGVADERHYRIDPAKGQLTFSWHPETAEDRRKGMVSDTLFWLAASRSEKIQAAFFLPAAVLPGEVYEEGIGHHLALQIRDKNITKRALAWLGQNIPNPWVSATTVPYFVPEAGPVLITLTDLLGRPHWRNTQMVAAGEQLLPLTRNMVPGPGIYRITLVWQGEILSRTLILQPDR
ncbi:MAG: hypothetical protein H6555_10730 [Lewinellaceae bacterium]|nr:hypothetical protein [Lewinellaceae bacterium]